MCEVKLNNSQIGDIGESTFMLECIKRGYTIAKPFGNNKGYDVIVDNGQQLFTVQVKAANEASSTATHKVPAAYFGAFRSEDADFLVCYYIPTNDFYIIPSSAVDSPRLRIGRVSRWDGYKNNWTPLEPET